MNSGDRVRYQLTLHYDGSGFHGWQVQKEGRTVQGELESALERLTGARRAVIGSGRTDRGVHATGQVASVDVPSRWSGTELRRALNAVLPDEIWVAGIARVGGRFHPRYDAVSRTYTYRLGTAPEAESPFHRLTCWPLSDSIDRSALEEAASSLPGNHSFRSFAKAGQEERGDRCTVQAACWEPWRLGFLFRITADRYLHHMVRYLVGTMVDIARQRRPGGDMVALLEGSAPDLETSPPAPPQGLFLTRVEYPPHVLDPDHVLMPPQGGASGDPIDHADLS